MAITVHEESKRIDNRVEEIPADNMPLHYKTKGEDIEEPIKEEIIKAPAPFEIDQERGPLPFSILHKAANPYRLPIPLKCYPKKVDNDKKLQKLKDPGSFMVSISIGGKENMRAILDLGVSINIMPDSIYLRLGLGQLKLAPMTLQLTMDQLSVLRVL